MIGARPPLRARRLLVACLFLAAIMVGSFLPNTPASNLMVLFILATAICLIGYGATVSGYRRPEKWPMFTALAIGVVTVFAVNTGGHSLWLTAFGESLRCKVISVDSHSSSRGSTQWSNELDCGGRTLTYWPSLGHTVEDVGREVDVVVDKARFVRELEPGKVSLGFNLLFLLALLMNGAFVFLVAWLPVRKAVPAAEE
ncbi:hypothetical protein SAMN04488564_103674 [Lentzea waywayandensis]|uniref:Uncharacterized protein n=1 Tax=Lentzea waywayandensis TaxID=84724 RepID=A0A1I6E2Q7_9PSEU|nr:hypothetical protein [Lentzea waywayandensis]SFR11831.1 hypothetical protein SAMN04488564_103674 [Lentzea waywayandensis]